MRFPSLSGFPIAEHPLLSSYCIKQYSSPFIHLPNTRKQRAATARIPQREQVALVVEKKRSGENRGESGGKRGKRGRVAGYTGPLPDRLISMQ